MRPLRSLRNQPHGNENQPAQPLILIRISSRPWPAARPLAGRCRLIRRPDHLNAEIRFLLTFDDGPAVEGPTASVLEQLKNNSVQPNVKAIFFVQTRSPRNGGTEEGWRMMVRENAEEHVLGLHSGSRADM